MEKWPITKANTVLNIVPEGQEYVVERFGRFDRKVSPGWFIAIPIIDNSKTPTLISSRLTPSHLIASLFSRN